MQYQVAIPKVTSFILLSEHSIKVTANDLD